MVSSELLSTLDFSRRDQPRPGTDLHALLIEWLEYQRGEFLRKLRDLSPEDLVRWSVPPVELSVMGLVRHMTQMEHVYLSCGLGGGSHARNNRTQHADDQYGNPDEPPNQAFPGQFFCLITIE